MKFKDYEIIKNNHGFEYAKNGILKSNKLADCIVCGESTSFIEVCSESHFCSDECVDKWSEYYCSVVEEMEE